MKNDLAQLFVTMAGVGFALCLIGICLCGLYAMADLAWSLWGRETWESLRRRPERPSAPRLVDAEAEGWLDELEWGFPGRRTVEAQAGDQTGEMELPRLGVAA